MFAALPRELQEELRSAYSRRETAQAQGIIMGKTRDVEQNTVCSYNTLERTVDVPLMIKFNPLCITPLFLHLLSLPPLFSLLSLNPSFSVAEQRNPLLQLKQVGVGRVKRRYKKKNTNSSPIKKGLSPLKRPHPPGNSPAKALQHPLRPRDLSNGLKVSP